MGFISDRRVALWVQGLERWATKEVAAHTEQTAKGKNRIDPHGMYCLGVLSAVTMAKGTKPGRPPAPKDRDQRQDLADASALLRRVVTAGRPPGRDYLELLGNPGSAPGR
jgi:hypothetical protein